jgi:hypothetical protein
MPARKRRRGCLIPTPIPHTHQRTIKHAHVRRKRGITSKHKLTGPDTTVRPAVCHINMVWPQARPRHAPSCVCGTMCTFSTLGNGPPAVLYFTRAPWAAEESAITTHATSAVPARMCWLCFYNSPWKLSLVPAPEWVRCRLRLGRAAPFLPQWNPDVAFAR